MLISSVSKHVNKFFCEVPADLTEIFIMPQKECSIFRVSLTWRSRENDRTTLNGTCTWTSDNNTD